MAIKTFNLTKVYSNNKGCKEICLSVDRGQIFGLLGPNGAGKSTLVKMLVGLLFPSSGSALILGKPLGDIQARRKIGYLPEVFRYQPWLTGEELLSFHGRLAGMNRAELQHRIPEVLAQVGIAGSGKHKVGVYSKGMQQRIGLACALLPDPDLVFLDEPTSALDPLGRRQVREILLNLKTRGKTVFLNSHLLSEIELVCDQVQIINNGRIVAGGTVQQLLANSVRVNLQVKGLNKPMLQELKSISKSVQVNTDSLAISLDNEAKIPALAQIVLKHGGELYSLQPNHNSLEDLYVNLIQGGGDQC